MPQKCMVKAHPFNSFRNKDKMDGEKLSTKLAESLVATKAVNEALIPSSLSTGGAK